MKTIILEDFEFDYNSTMDCIVDKNNNKIIFVSRNYDEIHLVIEINEFGVLFHPRWNVKIGSYKNQHNKYYIDVNFADESINLNDCPIVK